MGKRPRTPHFISGIGDGHVNVNENNNNNNANHISSNSKRVPTDDRLVLGAGNNADKNSGTGSTGNTPDRYFIRSRNERLARMEEPLISGDQWRDIFSGDPALGKPSPTLSGPWQVSAFALLGVVVVMSAIFLHMVADNHDNHSSPYGTYRRRQRQARRQYKTRKKKKTDEWSDDEEDLIIQNGARQTENWGGVSASSGEDFQMYPYFYGQGTPGVPSNPGTPGFSSQEHRLRRTGNKDSDASPTAPGRQSNYYMPAVNAKYRSPSAKLMSGIHRRGVSPGNSFNSNASGGRSPGPNMRPTAVMMGGYTSGGSHAASPSNLMRATAPISGRYRVPTPPDAHDIFPHGTIQHTHSSGSHNLLNAQPLLPTAPEEAQLPSEEQLFADNPFLGTSGKNQLGARPLNSSNFSSFASMEGPGNDHLLATSSHSRRRGHTSSEDSADLGDLIETGSHHSHHTHNSNHLVYSSLHSSHQRSLLLSPGNYEAETPQIANARKKVTASSDLMNFPNWPPQLPDGEVPFMPNLDSSKGSSNANASPIIYSNEKPPRSVLMDELRLVQMETGNSTHWVVKDPSERPDDSETQGSFYEDEINPNFQGDSISNLEDSEGSDISIPSGDPRKGIIHKRSNLTMSTDAHASLQSSIDFEELKLEEVIGGGGFGQVWRATWRGTPVAVKVLTGSAQNTHIAKAILEEFKAEINLLKGMRHPNICLYMGASLRPPNRAIVTELAANGSVWDALRLPLSPPYVPADGTARGSWPSALYMPGEHGAPPSHSPQISVPIPPKGSWPWPLVKRVACGAARGMAYLHSGNPPVLHRDLKSANLLLDESYTTKVCDFGLSRLKAQSRSMTGNCGTVQWMAPEVLANMSYDEKADVFSYGIILWELLTRECPYDGMTAIQCALAVLNRDKRPDIPKWCPPALHALIKSCIKKDPNQRPQFTQIIMALDAIDG